MLVGVAGVVCLVCISVSSCLISCSSRGGCGDDVSVVVVSVLCISVSGWGGVFSDESVCSCVSSCLISCSSRGSCGVM